MDVRAEAEAARREDAVLVADLTGVSPLGCAALRLGADALVAPLSGALAGHALVAVAPGASVEAELPLALPDAHEVDEALLAGLLELDAAWGRASDCAQVLCAYLACHPAVERVGYPGLKGDASFEVAARTLRGGFGPLVDVRLAAGRDLDEALLVRAGVTARRLTLGEVRLHVGGGDAREVIGALERALAAADGDAGRRA
nr:PLP-dependent transferase [Olsenella intestinalis]